jgi:hypothetical protein
MKARPRYLLDRPTHEREWEGENGLLSSAAQNKEGRNTSSRFGSGSPSDKREGKKSRPARRASNRGTGKFFFLSFFFSQLNRFSNPN